MTLRSRALRIAVATAPERADVYLTADMLAKAAGITRATLARLVRAGLVEPASPGESVFTAAMAARLRRMLRLRSIAEQYERMMRVHESRANANREKDAAKVASDEAAAAVAEAARREAEPIIG